MNTSDVAIGVPSVGAFFAGSNTTARSYCPVVTIVGLPATTNSTTTNIFYPDAAVLGPQTDRIATTDDGKHVLGADGHTNPDLYRPLDRAGATLQRMPRNRLDDRRHQAANVSNQHPPSLGNCRG